MVIISVPNINDSVSRITLSGKVYHIRFTYNPTFDYWSIGVYDEDLNPVVAMTKVVVEYPLTEAYKTYVSMPDGIIGCYSPYTRVTRNSFVNRDAIMLYIPYSDLGEDWNPYAVNITEEVSTMDDATDIASLMDDFLNDSLLDLIIYVDPAQEGSGVPSPDNVRQGKLWSQCRLTVSPTQSIEDGTEYDILWSDEGAIVGGMVSLPAGVQTLTYGTSTYSEFDGALGLTENGYAVYIDTPNHTKDEKMLCDCFAYSNLPYDRMALYTFGSGSGGESRVIFILPTTVTSLQEANDWLENGVGSVTISEKLKTPAVRHLSPDEYPRIGESQSKSYAWADCGEVIIIQ